MEIQRRLQLVDLLRHFNLDLVGAELGVCGGNFSHELLSNGMSKLYSIDSWRQLDGTGDGAYPDSWHSENYEKAKELLSEFGMRSIIIKETTNEAHFHFDDRTLSLVYQDANHSYENIKEDIENWFPKLVFNGIMAFHDYDNEGYGVKKAVEEFAQHNNLQIHYIPENSVGDSGAWIQKNFY